MVQLTDLEISRCQKCGKMFQMTSGRRLCRECGGEEFRSESEVESTVQKEERIIARLARESGLDAATIRRAFYDLPEEAAPQELVTPCVRCRERPVIEDSDFCLYCHLDLYRALGDASNHLFHRMEVVEQGPGSSMSVMSSYRRKRSLTGARRLNLVDTTVRKTF